MADKLQALLEHLDALKGSKNARLLAGEKLSDELPITKLPEQLQKKGNNGLTTLVMDGIITQRLADLAPEAGISTVVAEKKGPLPRKPVGLSLYTRKDLMEQLTLGGEEKVTLSESIVHQTLAAELAKDLGVTDWDNAEPGNSKEPKKPNWKTKKEQGRSNYLAFLVFLVLSIVVLIPGEEDEVSDGQVCCFSLFFLLTIIYLAMGVGSTARNVVSPTRGDEFTEEWKKYERDHAAYLKSREAEKKASLESKKKAAAEAKARKRKAAAEAKARKLPNIVCRVEKSGNAFRAWSTDGYDYTPQMNSRTRRKALEGNYLLGRFKSSAGRQSWRRITATVLKNLGGKRNIVFEDPKEKPKKRSKKKPSSKKPSKKCEHCGFLNKADNNPSWAAMYRPELADFFEGTAGADITCADCGYNFWVSSDELAGKGAGSGAQFTSFSPGGQDAMGDYLVGLMNKQAEEAGDSVRYDLPSKLRKKKAPAKKKAPVKSTTSTSRKTRLKEAKEFFDEGLIDEEEYKQMKNEILRSKK